MPEQTILNESDDLNLPIASMPKTALQALYNAVTGKTESLSQDINGSVIINSGDIDRLYDMIIDQIQIHPMDLEPVVTVLVKCANSKSITYSSWERYKVLRVSNHDVTSEITLKFEFVIQLPNTPKPQRCIVNINLDSSLPVIKNHRDQIEDAESFGYFFIMKGSWRTLRVSIDFVDFLVAKSFVNLAEEWFKTLPKSPKRKFNDFLMRNISIIRLGLSQIGRIGMASFLIGFVEFSQPSSFVLTKITLGVALGFIIWAILATAEGAFGSRVMRRVSINVVPTIILLTDSDKKSYDDVINGMNSPTITIINSFLSVLGGIAINVIASYIFLYFHP